MRAHSAPPRRDTPIDYLGAALLATAAGGLIVTLSTSGKAWP